MLQYNSAQRATRGRKIRLPALTVLCWLVCTAQAATAATLVTSVKPLQMIAQAVVGEGTPIERIVPDGANPHDYVLRPSDADKAVHSDLLIWLGPVAEPYLARIGARPGGAKLDVSQLPGLTLLPARRLVQWEAHDHDHGHAHHQGSDQHLWLNTGNAAVIADAMAARFAQLDSAGAARYQQNAADFKRALKQREMKWQEQAQSVRSSYFIAYHDAYQYLEQQFGFSVATVLTLEPEIKPGARHLLQVKKAVETHAVRCFVTEPGYDPNLLKKVMPVDARQTQLDVHGSGVKLSSHSYLEFIDGILSALTDCLHTPL